MKRVLGIDPGIAITGFGVVEKQGHQLVPLAFGTIRTDKALSLPERLDELYRNLTELITLYNPDAAAIEELYFSNNAKTALIVGQARGVALLTLFQAHLTIASYTPPQIKLAVCGFGGADKYQIQHMVKQLMNLDTIPKPDDAADALAVAICHWHSYKMTGLKGVLYDHSSVRHA